MRTRSCTALLLATIAAAPGEARAQPLLPEAGPALDPGAGEVPFPHPALIEVFFGGLPRAIPGDANLDGQRSATGDEFVEIMNPHDRPIDLAGYRIEDGEPNSEWRLVWTFPPFSLAPGERVVVFNGFRNDEIPGDDGVAARPPRMKNPHFGDAWVFSMEVVEPWRAFTNEADYCLLRDPEGRPVDVVAWGRNPERSMEPPADALRTAIVPEGLQGSFQRLEPFGPMILHKDIDGRLFSPGEIPIPSPEKAAGDGRGEDAGAQGG